MLHAFETIQSLASQIVVPSFEQFQNLATQIGVPWQNSCCVREDELQVRHVKDVDIDDGKSFFDEGASLCLPPGKKMTVMMFGMTGAGKSALGNLMAGLDFFTSGGDSASVTNTQSVKRYEAPDESLVVLDTIGLGDTKLDQEKVVNSICDSALSAPNGIDAVFFVLRNGRITDDLIARVIYVTQYLWGSECLLNLYVIITHAAKYVKDRKDGEEWITRQIDINWRFRHIYSLAGRNPNRIIFVDNPNPEDGEPFAAVRAATSRRNIFRALLSHPREAIPPFTHQMMIKARELTEATWHEVQRAEEKVQLLQEKEQQLQVQAAYHWSHAPELVQARQQKAKAEKAWYDDLERVKDTEEFHQAAIEIVVGANNAFETGCDVSALVPDITTVEESVADSAAPVEKSAKHGGPFEAMKRMLTSVKTQMSRVVRPKRGSKEGAAAKAKFESWEDIERATDEALLALINGIQEDPLQLFQKLDAKGTGLLSPDTFNRHVTEVGHGLSLTQLAGLWRRADANADGFIDQSEFCQLLAPLGANGLLQGAYCDSPDNERLLQMLI